MGEMGNAYVDLVSKSEGTGPLGRLKYVRKNNTKMNVK
jgi:hypothetical protein